MNIREQVGQRITKARKHADLTIKKLAEITGLNPSRISNWEQGTRLIQLEEAMQLAETLKVPTTYLLCLSDETTNITNPNDTLLKIIKKLAPRVIPILDSQTAANHKVRQEISIKPQSELLTKYDHLPITQKNAGELSEDTFAYIVEDKSMLPVFSKGDIIIIEPTRRPRPGDYVLAQLKNQDTVVLRKYYERINPKNNNPMFELAPINQKDFITYHIKSERDGIIIGTMIECRHYV